jgi:hypothetical protein
MPNPPGSLRRGPVLILLLAGGAAVCAVGAMILAAAYFFGQSAPGASGVLHQHDTVSPGSKSSGIVYYPIPFAAPPNLKITSAKRQYDIVKQDESGFTWKAVATIDDIRDDPEVRRHAEAMISVGIKHADDLGGRLKPDLQFEDFTWEAKGVRADPAEKLYPQDGTFNTVPGLEGEVTFPFPYAAAPNVELSGPPAILGKVIIVETRPTGFKWKNAGKDDTHGGTLTWKAKGLRATKPALP